MLSWAISCRRQSIWGADACSFFHNKDVSSTPDCPESEIHVIVSLRPWAFTCRSHHRSGLWWTDFHNGSVDRWITVLPRAVLFARPPFDWHHWSQDFSRWIWVACSCLATYCMISILQVAVDCMLLKGSVLAFFSPCWHRYASSFIWMLMPCQQKGRISDLPKWTPASASKRESEGWLRVSWRKGTWHESIAANK